jgi:tetratricopeptide (TPR) repeat protein
LVALSPDLAFTHNSLGYSLAAQGRFEEAEKELRRATEIDPNDAYALPNLGHVLLAMGRAAEAIPVYLRVYELAKQGRSSGTPAKDGFAVVLALRESGNAAEAAKIAAECRDLVLKGSEGRSSTDKLIILGLLAAAAGDTAEASGNLKKALAGTENDPYQLMNIAELQAVLEQKREAIATIKKSLAAGYFDYFFPVILPGFQSIRDHPEFKAIFQLSK